MITFQLTLSKSRLMSIYSSIYLLIMNDPYENRSRLDPGRGRFPATAAPGGMLRDSEDLLHDRLEGTSLWR